VYNGNYGRGGEGRGGREEVASVLYFEFQNRADVYERQLFVNIYRTCIAKYSNFVILTQRSLPSHAPSVYTTGLVVL